MGKEIKLFSSLIMKKEKKLTKKKLNKLLKREVKKQFLDWSIKVKERDGNHCALCPSVTLLNAHHLIGREFKQLRFDLDNGISLCPFHHQWSKDISPHRNSFVFFVWFMTNRKEQYQRLLEKAFKLGLLK